MLLPRLGRYCFNLRRISHIEAPMVNWLRREPDSLPAHCVLKQHDFRGFVVTVWVAANRHRGNRVSAFAVEQII
jgi:hypothetical protein